MLRENLPQGTFPAGNNALLPGSLPAPLASGCPRLPSKASPRDSSSGPRSGFLSFSLKQCRLADSLESSRSPPCYLWNFF